MEGFNIFPLWPGLSKDLTYKKCINNFTYKSNKDFLMINGMLTLINRSKRYKYLKICLKESKKRLYYQKSSVTLESQCGMFT